MNRKPMLKFAASIAIVMAGTAVPMALTAGSGDTAAQPERADRAADRANRMLDRGRTEQAVIECQPDERCWRGMSWGGSCG